MFRRDEGRAYASLDYGHSGGGHGHPDRLNLVLVHGAVRWLDDFGTGSYVDRTLHWYRSTLAHNAPLADGRSQRPTNGTLGAYDEREDCGWVSAEAEIAPGVRVRRSIVVLPTYLVDRVEWDGNEATPPPPAPDGGEVETRLMFDLPIHAALELTEGVGAAVLEPLPGAHGLEDGFDFAHDTSFQHAAAGATVVGRVIRDGARASVWARATAPCEWWRASALGAPGLGDHVFRLVRAREVEGRHEFVWSWSDAVVGVEFGESLRVTLVDGAVHEHNPATDRWAIVFAGADGKTRGVTLAGVATRTEAPASDAAAPAVRAPLRVLREGETKVTLGAEHYRRSEEAWTAAGGPTADVAFRALGSTLSIRVTIPRSDVTFAPRNAENPLDNESADVNGDGIQLYARTSGKVAAWMLVPELGGDHVRVRGITGTDLRSAPPLATWQRMGDGYSVNIELDGRELSAIDVIVNEMPRGRDRRRGQLVLSGGDGEFVYLRGDRQADDRLIPIEWEGADD